VHVHVHVHVRVRVRVYVCVGVGEEEVELRGSGCVLHEGTLRHVLAALRVGVDGHNIVLRKDLWVGIGLM
jgi:hypothetical protein